MKKNLLVTSHPTITLMILNKGLRTDFYKDQRIKVNTYDTYETSEYI